MGPGPGAVGAQRPLPEHHRVGRLEDFHRRDRRRRDRRVAVVQPVAFDASAMAAAEEAEHDPALPVRAFARQRQRVDRAVGVGHDPPGRGLRRGGEDHVDHPQDGLGIAAHRRGNSAARSDPSGTRTSIGPHDACIGRQVGEDVLDRDIGRGDRRRQGDVDRPRRHRRRAREIEDHPVARDLQRHADRQGGVGDPVIVEEILGLPSPVRQVGQLRPHQRLGPVLQRVERGAHGLRPVFIEQRVKALHPQVERAQLPVQVPHRRLRQAGVAHQDVDDVLLHLALAGKLHRGRTKAS
jgi:hypothetical protein